MSNSTISGMVPVIAQAAEPWLLVAQSDLPILSCFDEILLGNSPYLSYQTHIVSNSEHGEVRPTRIKFYGRGTVTAGLIILSVDMSIRAAWNANLSNTDPMKNILLWQETDQTFKGYEFDVWIVLSGVGIDLFECVLEFVTVT